MASQAPPRIALVHEWLGARNGSEKTFETLCQALPHAETYALTMESNEFTFPRPPRTTFIQRLGPLRSRRAVMLPLMPLAWRLLGRKRYDLVLTSSHAFSRYFPVHPGTICLSYVYSPLRYGWFPEIDTRTTPIVQRAAAPLLRRTDLKTVPQVTEFAAISQEVADRVRNVYGRPAKVIYPPVDVDYFTPPDAGPHGRATQLLAVSRLVPYKRLDLAVEVAARVDLPLTIIGSGPEERSLRRLADHLRATVHFRTDATDAELREAYRNASAVIFPALEDFGIVPVEAQATGTPVVALGRGGCAETVVHGTTGQLVEAQTTEAFTEATAACLEMGATPEACRANASRFSRQAFTAAMLSWVKDHLE